jgi:hypothetical protein
MSKALKILAVIIAIIGFIAIIGVTYLKLSYPKVGPAPDLKVEATPERLARGEYLAKNVMGCLDCHAQRDFSYYGGPAKPGTEGIGGDLFDETLGFPGKFYARNITPHAIGDWTDGELYRLITTGVRKDGEPIFPVMPYHLFGKADPEDIYSVIAYIRTLKPVENSVPESKPSFPFSLIMRTIPQEAQPGKRPDPSDAIAYGKYVATLCACNDCHTPIDKNQRFIESKFFAGGREFLFPGLGIIRPANITPHPTTGIGSWSEDFFVQRFKNYATPEAQQMKVGPGEFNTFMPWLFYAGMTEEDLRALYKYIMSIPAVDNKVERLTPM